MAKLKTIEEKFIIAEYCRGPFYMGWWMYARDTNDGRRNADGCWGWTHREARIGDDEIRKFCQSIGAVEIPEVEKHSSRFAEWFAATYPAGLLVRLSGEHYFPEIELIEIVKELPKQPRGVIRTVRAAKISFGRCCEVRNKRAKRAEAKID